IRTLFVILNVVILLCGATWIVSAAVKQVTVEVKTTTGKPVPVAISMTDLREALGVDFPADWNSLRVLDAKGKEIPFQIDDLDLSGTVSKNDELAFLATGPCTVTVRDDAGRKPAYPDQFTATPGDKGTIAIASKDGKLAALVSNMGTLDLLKFEGIAHKYVKDVAMIRYAGFPNSTYWYDQSLGGHEEKTTFEEPLRVVKLQVLTSSPVRATVVVQTASELFPALRQSAVISIYTTGEIRVKNRVTSKGYTDLTKLFTMANGVMSDCEDAAHLLPVFRYLDWAEELKLSPAEYWKKRNVLLTVDGKDYVAFNDATGPKPAWWGASYLFASAERWRTNFSAKAGLGLAEMLMNVPEVPGDLADKIKAEGWHLEGEWRTGYFRWVAGEMISIRANNGIKVELNMDMAGGDWPLHMIPGDYMEHLNFYAPYAAKDRQSAIRYLEARYAELASVALR
ncbi:MAG: hypothetical protein ACM3XS_03610, partial [Bacteroidota bacterium]